MALEESLQSGQSATRINNSSLPLKQGGQVLDKNRHRKGSQGPRPEKENKYKIKTKPSRKKLGLLRDQRYFQIRNVTVDPIAIQKLGLYEAGNLFKTKNIAPSLQQLTVVAQKPENVIKLGNSCELFVTDVISNPPQFSVQHFIEEELGKHLSVQKVIPECDSFPSSNQLLSADSPDSIEPNIQNTVLFLTFKGYQVVEDESFRLFKARHVKEWGAVILNIKNISKCLESHKVMQIKVKQQHLLFWEGKKTTLSRISQILGLKRYCSPQQQIEKVVLAFADRLKVAVIKRRISRKQSLARWVAERLKAIYRLRQLRKDKIQRAKQLSLELRQHLEWEVEIHIPSFSVDAFKRNTTQYMESFQAQYHCLWETTSIPLILVLPTLNQVLLRLLQTRIKLNRPVTIITPEIYSSFPANLSLAAQVYFSHQTLEKIEAAVGNRKAVLVGGMFCHSMYETLISQYLNIPILGSIRTKSQCEEEKHFFSCAEIDVSPYCLIPAGISTQALLQLFAGLLIDHDSEKTWVLKIRGEFRGRGIATVKLNPSKYLRAGMDRIQMKSALIDALRTSLRLKLKVNFQNSVYAVEDFLLTLRKEGGIIQEWIQVSATYELCFEKVQNCTLKSIFRVYGANFSNKVWLTITPNSNITSLADKLIKCIENQQRYLGHLSCTLCQTANGQFFGVDVKLGITQASSLFKFTEMIESKRSLVETEAINISRLPTRRPSFDPQDHSLRADTFRYLFIPSFPFTDVEEESKAKLVTELMKQCWNDRHLRLGHTGKVLMSLGVDFCGVLMGRDVKRLRREGVQMVRQLAERVRMVREYRGKEVIRDVFEPGDVIRAISQIRNEQ